METAIKELKAQLTHISTESILGMISLNFVSVAVKRGAIHYEGNGNVDDSQFTNKTSGNGGTDSN